MHVGCMNNSHCLLLATKLETPVLYYGQEEVGINGVRQRYRLGASTGFTKRRMIHFLSKDVLKLAKLNIRLNKHVLVNETDQYVM